MFDNLKDKFRERIEKNAIKLTNVEWKDQHNKTHREDVIYIKRSTFPLIGDWGRIYPVVNEDNSWNLTNLIFGGKKNLIKFLVIVTIVGFALFEFNNLFNYIEQLNNLPCVKSCLEIGVN